MKANRFVWASGQITDIVMPQAQNGLVKQAPITRVRVKRKPGKSEAKHD